jgi:hypothetical protein
MTARQRRDTAHLRQAVRQRDPGGDVLVRGIESEVGSVLVPGDERVVARLLDPHREVVDEQIRADQVLDGGEHRRVADEAVEPGEEKDASWREAAGERPSGRPWRLRRLRASARHSRASAGDSAGHGTEKTVLVVTRHLLVG